MNTHLQEQATKKPLKSLLAASSGNLVEWYDFYIYAFLAPYFAKEFTQTNDPTLSLISAFLVFMLGFFMRPLGSLFFGKLGDKKGRKTSMVCSIILMALGSFMLALLPTKEIVGEWAFLFLLFARLLQGFSVGGEYGVVATYLSELGKNGKKGFYGSFQYVTLVGGQLLAIFSLFIVENIYTHEQISEFAWRYLFGLGGILALLSLFLRNTMEETLESKETHKKSHRGSLKELLNHKKALMLVLGITMGGSLCFYTFTIYLKIFLTNSSSFSAKESSFIMLLALTYFILLQPLCGTLADKIKRPKMLMVFGIMGLIVTPIVFYGIKNATHIYEALLYEMLALTAMSFYTCIAGVIKAELFPSYVRALGVGLAYAIANALFGGSASYVALQFKQHGFEEGFVGYVMFSMLIFIVMVILFPKKTYMN
ncbi:MFS transporter [Helicobacter cetorum]|uniref:Alpha-ketoglutarate permease n=1 Tax=Helicobacter cetorum (strain ATCC BAA-540 / CCUG 52418 / MIT 99-5656) TaxID=1163745 RepID=I0ETM5_HELCM|nr:MFS transporter [Helicobacter cetorum]AFI06294.1 alpha-ketoglutarate permease [Helicobacter cetorum MIT 99-5656]